MARHDESTRRLQEAWTKQPPEDPRKPRPTPQPATPKAGDAKDQRVPDGGKPPTDGRR